ncbi:hypothetical protein [Bradyrhizobium sp. B117]|uniref:hypothetical protein n=2 Tax=Bradyrhizobium TaxID=374 RepID=UPI0031830FB4
MIETETLLKNAPAAAIGRWPRACSGRHPRSRMSGSGVQGVTVTRRAGCGARSCRATRLGLLMRPEMKIRSHSESHIVELEDGSRWQIFPGDLDLTLDWKPETELTVVEAKDEVATHELLGAGGKVRVRPVGDSWPAKDTKDALKDG